MLKITRDNFFQNQLEQRQNKNDSIQSKIIPILKLPRFSPHRIGGEKARQFQSWNYFLLNGLSFLYCLGSSDRHDFDLSKFFKNTLTKNTKKASCAKNYIAYYAGQRPAM